MPVEDENYMFGVFAEAAIQVCLENSLDFEVAPLAILWELQRQILKFFSKFNDVKKLEAKYNKNYFVIVFVAWNQLQLTC